jgi:hypothetical protein
MPYFGTMPVIIRGKETRADTEEVTSSADSSTTSSATPVNYSELAKKVTELYEKTAGAIIVRKGGLVAAYARPGMPLPQKDKLTELILQAELVVSISRRNADIFGEVKAAVIQHSLLTIFIMPLHQDITLAFAMEGAPAGDHSYEKLTASVAALIRKTDATLYS